MDTSAQIKHEKLITILDQLNSIVIGVLAFILPLAYNPFNNESPETTKYFLFILGISLIVLLWSLKSIIGKRVQLNLSFLQLPLLVFLGTVFVSSLFSLNRYYSFFGEPGVWHLSFFGLLAAFLFLLITATVVQSQKSISLILVSFISSITLANILEILGKAGVLGRFGISGNFILTGSAFSLWLFSAVSLVIAFFLFKQKLVQSQNRQKMFFLPLLSLVGLINLFSLIFLSSGFLTQNPLKAPLDLRLDLQSSWIIATTALQNFPIFGSGPATFSIDFNSFKPASLNLTAVWNLQFSKAGNELLTMLPTLGLTGTLVFILFIFLLARTIVKKYWSAKSEGTNWSLGIVLLLLIGSLVFTNFSLTTFFVFFLVLALWLAERNINADEEIATTRTLSFAAIRDYLGNRLGTAEKKAHDQIELMPYIFGVFGLILSLAAFFIFGQMYLAQNQYLLGIQSANNGDNNAAVNHLINASNLNPNLDLYRVALSQLFLAKANELNTKKTLTDQETSLLQNDLAQAVTQIKLATEKLNPVSAANWIIRARIYQSLAGTLPADAKPEDPKIQNQLQILNLALTAYQQAISLDPVNPQLKLDLGGLLFSQRNFAQAEQFFTQAINLKANLPNAYYNLAYALKNQNKNAEAVTALQNTLSLLPKESAEYQQAQTELEALQKLITPTPTPTPATKP